VAAFVVAFLQVVQPFRLLQSPDVSPSRVSVMLNDWLIDWLIVELIVWCASECVELASVQRGARSHSGLQEGPQLEALFGSRTTSAPQLCSRVCVDACSVV
jgi:hypothetical protein